MRVIEEIERQHIIKDPPSKELMRILGMIVTYPKNAKFATQNPDENVVMVIRKHFFRNASWVFNAFIIFIIPFALAALIGVWDNSININSIFTEEIIGSSNIGIVTALLFFYLGFVSTYAYFSFIHWFYDVFIITNERYISIDFDILHGRTIVDIPLSDIIDVSEKVLGFLPTMIGYGNIEFKTTSEKFIVLDNIPSPTWFRDSFVDLIHFIRDRKTIKLKAQPKQKELKINEVLSTDFKETLDELEKVEVDDKDQEKELSEEKKANSKYIEP
jgi:hypothetical protein